MTSTKNELLKHSLVMVFILTWMTIISVWVIGGLRQRVTELEEKCANLQVNMEVTQCK